MAHRLSIYGIWEQLFAKLIKLSDVVFVKLSVS